VNIKGVTEGERTVTCRGNWQGSEVKMSQGGQAEGVIRGKAGASAAELRMLGQCTKNGETEQTRMVRGGVFGVGVKKAKK